MKFNFIRRQFKSMGVGEYLEPSIKNEIDALKSCIKHLYRGVEERLKAEEIKEGSELVDLYMDLLILTHHTIITKHKARTSGLCLNSLKNQYNHMSFTNIITAMVSEEMLVDPIVNNALKYLQDTLTSTKNTYHDITFFYNQLCEKEECGENNFIPITGLSKPKLDPVTELSNLMDKYNAKQILLILKLIQKIFSKRKDCE